MSSIEVVVFIDEGCNCSGCECGVEGAMARATAPDMPAKVDLAMLMLASAIRSDMEKLSGRRSGKYGMADVGFDVLAAASDIMASLALISVPSNRAIGVGTHCGTKCDTRYNFLSNGNERSWHDVRIC